jgi:V8-like Glu-specific endopeptidase
MLALWAGLWAGAAEDFAHMSPAVQVICYKRTRTDQILPMSYGSGTLISPAGHILTNYHVVFDADEQVPFEAFEIAITFDLRKRPARRFTARVAAADRSLDLAVLRLNPKDALGRELPELKVLDWNASVSPQQGQEIQVLGYPASGGETLTVSRGQISGFDRLNEYPCFKTDTDIDLGSSGGTVLDSRRRLIGVPVFLRSVAENVGYILDLRAARPWLAAHLADEPAVDAVAEARLTTELAAFVRANDERLYRTELYPRLELRLPEGWRFEQINADGLVIGQEGVADPASIGFQFDPRPFPLDDAFKAKLQEDIDRSKESYGDFAQESTTFAGADAWRITFTAERQRCMLMHVFLRNTLVQIIYRVEDRARERQQPALEQALAGCRFLEPPEAPPPAPQRDFFVREPGVKVTLPEGWGGRLNLGADDQDTLLTAWQQDNHDGLLEIAYRRVPAAKQQTAPAARLRETVNGTSVERIVRKQEDLLVDGLPGWLLVAEQNGADLKDLQRRVEAVILHDNHELVITYSDTAAHFERNAEAIVRLLGAIQVQAGERQNRGAYRVGALSILFTDIANHRFEEAIAALASKDLLRAYPDSRFDPEAPVTRAKTLRTVLDARNHLLSLTNPSRRLPLPEALPGLASDFQDLPAGHWAIPYARCAQDRGWLKLGAADCFEPDRPVSLLEGLTLLFAAFEIPLWSGPGATAAKPVMDKGYELELIPRGLDDPAHLLTNAEMAAVVEALSVTLER